MIVNDHGAGLVEPDSLFGHLECFARSTAISPNQSADAKFRSAPVTADDFVPSPNTKPTPITKGQTPRYGMRWVKVGYLGSMSGV